MVNKTITQKNNTRKTFAFCLNTHLDGIQYMPYYCIHSFVSFAISEAFPEIIDPLRQEAAQPVVTVAF